MSSVLPLPSFKDATRGLHVPSLKETSLDRDQYLLRLAQTVRMDLASSLGIDISEAGSLESWVEEAESSGWHVFLDDDEDDEGYGGDGTDSTKSQQVTGKSAGLTSGKYSIAYIKFNNKLIPRRMPEDLRYNRRQGPYNKPP